MLIIVAERIDSHNPPDPVTVRRAVIVVIGLAVTEPRELRMEFRELLLRDGLRKELMRRAFHSGAADNVGGPYPVPHLASKPSRKTMARTSVTITKPSLDLGLLKIPNPLEKD